MSKLPRPQYEHRSSASLFFRVQNCCWGAFTAGYTMSELGIAFGNLATIYGTDQDVQRRLLTFVVSILSVGALISAFVSHFVMHKYERRKFMMVADLIFMGASAFTQVETWYIFAAARFAMGIAVGMNTSVMSLYIHEISPENMQGKTGALIQANANLGIIAAFIWNLPLSSFVLPGQVGESWRYVFIFPALLSLLRLVMFLTVYKTDTPYYYYRSNQKERGRKALEQIYLERFVLTNEQNHLSPGSIDFADRDDNEHLLEFEGEERSYKKRLYISMAINFLQQLCGNTFLVVFLTGVVGVIGLEDEDNRSFVLGLYIFLFFASTLGVTFNRKLARRRYLIGGFGVCAVLQFIFSIVSYIEETNKDNANVRFIFFLVLFLFYGTYNFSVGPVTSIFTSDILKDKGITYSVAANWFGNIISLLLFLNTDLYINYIIFGVAGLIGCFVSFKFVIETRYLDYAQIQRAYNNGSSSIRDTLLSSQERSYTN